MSKKLFIQSYGCAMNFSDSEIVASILQTVGYSTTKEIESADLVLINTCSIREKAEQTVRKRLKSFLKIKQRKPDLTKAKELLNYKTKTSLEDGLKLTIDWISANYK